MWLCSDCSGRALLFLVLTNKARPRLPGFFKAGAVGGLACFLGNYSLVGSLECFLGCRS